MKQKVVLPSPVLQAILQANLPCYVYDTSVVRQRAASAASLLDRLFFPIKACPELEVVRAAIAAGCGLDLCSEGDAQIASAAGCPGHRWSFTAAHADRPLLQRLLAAGAVMDADSIEQALGWHSCGGSACGLRVTPANPHSLYMGKFGIPTMDIAAAARQMAIGGVRLEGLHVHDNHASLTPDEFAIRLTEAFSTVGRDILSVCQYLNIGGSWPMRHGNPASVEDLQSALSTFRQRVADLGFHGMVWAEPGRWVVGPCGYWAARVAALKPHPLGGDRSIVILDTSTPVPCKPSLGPFVALRDGAPLKAPRSLTCDLYGAANTALDSVGLAVRLPPLALGDIVVVLGQGAYTRSLTPPFNERDRPAAVFVNS
jgi:diaminopimelate decarboxylase